MLLGVRDAVKAASQLASAAAKATVDHQMKDKLIGIQQAILDIQEKLGDAQEDRLRLLTEIGELREELKNSKASRASLEGYELVEVESGKFLYRLRSDQGGTVPHYVCPTCYTNGTISILQASRITPRKTYYNCQACEKFSLGIGPDEDINRSTTTHGWDGSF